MSTHPTPAGQVALVTGANKGIGREIAEQLAGLGMTVLVGARDPERGRRAAAELAATGADVHHLQLDVTDEASVAASATHVQTTYGHLDVLVNNAGVAADYGEAPSQTTVAVVRRTYEVNVLGAVAVTHAMLPLLRRAAAARIVNVSSALGSVTLNADPEQPQGSGGSSMLLGYNSSKAALNAITVLYANELRGTGILVNAVNPGYCATDLNGFRGLLSPAEGAKVAVEAATLDQGGPTGSFITAGGTLPW